MIFIHRVSEITRYPWDRVYQMNVVEFLNTVSYYISLKDYEAAQAEKQMRKMKRK